MIFGYARVSSKDQNPKRQTETLTHCDEIFIDMCSGKNTDRPQLQLMLQKLRSGDSVHVKSVDRLARNTKDLLALLEKMTEMSITVYFIDNHMTFSDDATSKFMITMLGAVGEMERAFIRQRQQEGINLAQKSGKYKGRQKSDKTKEAEILIAKKLEQGGLTDIEIMKLAGISRAQYYRIKKTLSESFNPDKFK